MVDQRSIIEAGITALARIDYCIGRILSYKPDVCASPGPPFAVVSHSEIPTALEQLCAAQALAYSCLFDTGKRHSESPQATKLRQERVSLIKSRCSTIDISQLRNKGVRNALFHFDERYLQAIIKYNNGAWLQDIALSHKESINMGPNAEQRMIRVYIFYTDELILFGETLNLLPLREECEKILAALGMRLGRV